MTPRIAPSRRTLPGSAPDRLAGIADVLRPVTDARPSAAELRRSCAAADALLRLGNDVIHADLLGAAGNAPRTPAPGVPVPGVVAAVAG